MAPMINTHRKQIEYAMGPKITLTLNKYHMQWTPEISLTNGPN